MSDAIQQEIEAIVTSYRAETLREMALASGKVSAATRINTNEAIACLRDTYFTRSRVQASLAQLDPDDRAVLDRLLRRGGQARSRSLQRELLEAGLATAIPDGTQGRYTGLPTRQGSRVFEDILARLTYHGLVFSRTVEQPHNSRSPKQSYHPGEIIFVPLAVREYLPAPPPPEPLPEPAMVISGEPGLLLRDLYLYWDQVRRDPIALNRNGTVPKRTLKALNSLLVVPDESLAQAETEAGAMRLLLLRQLLEGLKLLRIRGNQLQIAPNDPLAVPDFWGLPLAAQVQACLTIWPHLSWSGDLSAHTRLMGGEPRRARQQLLVALAEAESTGSWQLVTELLDQIAVRDPDFLFKGHKQLESGWKEWYYNYATGFGAAREETLAAMDAAEAGFIHRALEEILGPLGIAELGYTDGKLFAWRLTPFGASLLRQSHPNPDVSTSTPSPVAAEQAEDDRGRLVIQPTFQLLALGNVNLALLAQLDLFAVRKRTDHGVFEYQLTRESVYRAQQAGLDVASILRLLEENSAVGVPQNVRRSLEEWGALHERITFRRRVSLLQTATPDLLRKLQEHDDTCALLARVVAPDVAILAPAAEEQIIAALIARGSLPAVSDGDSSSADHSVTVDAEGVIRPLHAVPSLFLRDRLRRLAEPEGPAWRLTQRSIRRAGGSKARVLRVLEELGRLSTTPLSEELSERIRVWGGYYGEARTGTVTLIEFRDCETLAELLQNQELARWLTPFPAGERALAAVAPERLAQVQAILNELGIPVHQGLASIPFR